jgi:hypothetical protein
MPSCSGTKWSWLISPSGELSTPAQRKQARNSRDVEEIERTFEQEISDGVALLTEELKAEGKRGVFSKEFGAAAVVLAGSQWREPFSQLARSTRRKWNIDRLVTARWPSTRWRGCRTRLKGACPDSRPPVARPRACAWKERASRQVRVWKGGVGTVFVTATASDAYLRVRSGREAVRRQLRRRTAENRKTSLGSEASCSWWSLGGSNP